MDDRKLEGAFPLSPSLYESEGGRKIHFSLRHNPPRHDDGVYRASVVKMESFFEQLCVWVDGKHED